MLHLVLADFRAAGTEHFPAGTVLDDRNVNVPALQSAGMASILFEGAAVVTAQERYLVYRNQQNNIDGQYLVALLWSGGVPTGDVVFPSEDGIIREVLTSFATLGVQQLFVDDALGDDSNSGSAFGVGLALKTSQAAVDKLPDLVNRRVEIIMKAHLGTGYAPPLLGSRTVDSVSGKVWFIGDGVTVVQVPALAAAGTDHAKIVDPVGGLATDVFRAFTVEILDGDCAGYKRTVHSNNATDILFSQDTDIFSGTLFPSPGDSFRIVRPSVRWNTSLVNGEVMASLAQGGVGYVNIGFDTVETNVDMFLTWRDSTVNFYGVEMEQQDVQRYDWLHSSCNVNMGTDNINGSLASAPAAISAPYGAPDEFAWVGYGVSVVDTIGVGGPFRSIDNPSKVQTYVTTRPTRGLEIDGLQVRLHGGNIDWFILSGRNGPNTSLFAQAFGTNPIKMHSTKANRPCVWLTQTPGAHADIIGVDFDSLLAEVLKADSQTEIFEGCSVGKGQAGRSIFIEAQSRLLNFGAITIGDAVALDIEVAGIAAINKSGLAAVNTAIENVGSIITRAFF